MVRRILVVVRALFFTGCTLVITWAVFTMTRRVPASVHTGFAIGELQALAVLTTLKVPVADVVESHIDGHTGGVTAMLMVRGEILMGVDLSRAEVIAEDQGQHTIRLRVPRPTATSCRLDHAGTRLYSVDRHGLWVLSPIQQPNTAVVNRCYADAEKLLQSVAVGAGIVESAKAHATAVLTGGAMRLGWTLQIEWAD